MSKELGRVAERGNVSTELEELRSGEECLQSWVELRRGENCLQKWKSCGEGKRVNIVGKSCGV